MLIASIQRWPPRLRAACRGRFLLRQRMGSGDATAHVLKLTGSAIRFWAAFGAAGEDELPEHLVPSASGSRP